MLAHGVLGVEDKHEEEQCLAERAVRAGEVHGVDP